MTMISSSSKASFTESSSSVSSYTSNQSLIPITGNFLTNILPDSISFVDKYAFFRGTVLSQSLILKRLS